MNYILKESQLKVIIENEAQLQYLKRILPIKFDEVVRYVKSRRNYRELYSSEFVRRFFSVLMDVIQPYLIGRFGIDWDYESTLEKIKEAYLDDVMELWEKIHE
jgi:uncharacterized protein YabN with tetrapyrrole methylase and pyrophosphatase domain